MKNDIWVSAENVSKKFCRSLKHSMLYGLQDVVKTSFRVPTRSEHLRSGEFWALEEASFEIKKGECLGIIGPNGSGKTTLLKMVNGIFMPDEGQINIRGRVGGLIQLGAGFHPMLTGRENIYVNGVILGMNKKEIDAKFDSIVEFADIGDFLDSPVKYYSSGMFVRLGFAIAAHAHQDILLVDEVLAVGDAAFQEKCMKYITDIRKSDRAVLLVSHSMYRIESLCDRVLWVEYGKIKKVGETKDVINAYITDQEQKKMQETFEQESLDGGSHPVTIEDLEFLNLNGEKQEEFKFGEGVLMRIHFNAKRKVKRPHFNIRICNNNVGVVEASMLIDGYEGPDFIEGKGIVECSFPSMALTPKVYDVMLFGRHEEGIVDIFRMGFYGRFRVSEKGLESISMKGPMALNLIRRSSPVYLEHHWKQLTS